MLDEYMIDIMKFSVIVSFMIGMSHDRMRGVSRMAIGMLMISMIMLPIVDIIEGFDIENSLEFLNQDVEGGALDSEIAESAFEDGIAMYIAEQYGIQRDRIKVNADGFSAETMRAERIYASLTLRDAADIDYRELEELLELNFTNGGESEVSLIVG